MPFILGKTATNHVDLLDKIEQLVTGSSLDSANIPTVNAAGTGYVVADKVSLSGGTSTIVGEVEILTVGGSGEVTSLKISQSGVYTSTPGPTGITTTGGTGSGLTLDCTFVSNGWTTQRRTQEADTVTLNAGGTGYTNGDTLTVSSGLTASLVGQEIQATVTGETGGVITSISIADRGYYHEPPASLTGMAVTGGTGTGATLDVTLRNGSNVAREQQWIAKGDGSGSENIYVGARAYQQAAFHHWELAGMNGYTAANPWSNQPNISPGRYDSSEQGQYVPLDDTAMSYWAFVSPSRVIVIAHVGSTSYVNMYLGLYARFGTATEYPYPLMIMGCSSSFEQAFNSGNIGYSGMLDPISFDSHNDGPGRLLDTDGTWRTVRNSSQVGATRVRATDLCIYPAGYANTGALATEDSWATEDHDTLDLIPPTGIPGAPSAVLQQTPDTGGNLVNTLPTIILQAGAGGAARKVHGELDGVVWLGNDANLDSAQILSQDKIDVGSDRYHVFQNCRRVDQFAFFAVKEA